MNSKPGKGVRKMVPRKTKIYNRNRLLMPNYQSYEPAAFCGAKVNKCSEFWQPVLIKDY